MHHPLLLLALLPLGAIMWWALQSLREVNGMQRHNDALRADLERRFPWLREQDGPEP